MASGIKRLDAFNQEGVFTSNVALFPKGTKTSHYVRDEVTPEQWLFLDVSNPNQFVTKK